MSNFDFAKLGLAPKHTTCPLTQIEFLQGQQQGTLLGPHWEFAGLQVTPLIRRLPAVLLPLSIPGTPHTQKKPASSFFNFYFLGHFILLLFLLFPPLSLVFTVSL